MLTLAIILLITNGCLTKTKTEILYVSISDEVQAKGVMFIATEENIPVTVKTDKKTYYAKKSVAGYVLIKLADYKQLLKEAKSK